ncbi:uromodulin-like [Lissotriton helveticus]
MAVGQGSMKMLCIFISILCLNVIECQLISTSRAPDSTLRANGSLSSCASQTEASSLTYLVDTTGSMADDFQQLKIVNDWLLDRVIARFPCGVRRYTMVEFNDPGFGPSYATDSKTQFSLFFKNLTANGGGDCPELALSGLKLALETSPPSSFILVLTDASAKDYSDPVLLNDIYSLINSKKSQVSFLITGLCAGLTDPQFLIYRNISSRSFGHVFQVTLADLGKVFFYLDLTLSRPVNSSTPLFSGDYNTNGSYTKTFPVSQPYPALILTTDGLNTTLRLIGPNAREVEPTRIISESWGSMYQVKNPQLGIWSMNISAASAHSIRVEGFTATNISTPARCSDCHSNATCEVYFGVPECSCKDGFIGDGFKCSDIDECLNPWSNNCTNAICINTFGSFTCSCYYGYTLDARNACVDINECSIPSLSRCHAVAMCTNYPGSYACTCPPGFFGDGYACEPNECNTNSCGIGRDCVKGLGSYSCFDPCMNHTVLNEPWRSTLYTSGSISVNCDSVKKGWYRFIGSGGARMSEVCVPQLRCNTHAPMWINGSHPTTTDRIVNRTACANWGSSCCFWSTFVQIKMCPGGYFVYNITSTPACHLTYCTDPTYVDNPCSCTAEEECKEVNGVQGCYCKKNGSITDAANLQPKLKCSKNEFGASFQSCQLENMGFNTSNIRIKDSRCVGSLDRNVTNMVTFMHPTRAGQCGTQLFTNETHATYTNMIFLAMRSDQIITRDRELNISYSCTYPLDMKLSLLTALKPMTSSLSISYGGTGEFKLLMAIYRDPGYLSPYDAAEVSLSTKDYLYVGVMLDGGDPSQFNLVMRNCYATPSSSASDPIKYFIIKDSCPNKQDLTISVPENGRSTQGRFSVQMFKFLGDYNFVYLHCETRLCDTSKGPCAPSCSGVRSSSDDGDQQSYNLTVGPMMQRAVGAPTGSSEESLHFKNFLKYVKFSFPQTFGLVTAIFKFGINMIRAFPL